jgi:hypothetical protein
MKSFIIAHSDNQFYTSHGKMSGLAGAPLRGRGLDLALQPALVAVLEVQRTG